MRFKAFLLLCAALTGCGGGPTPDQSGVTADPSQAEVPLEVKSWDETAALIAQNKGKVVVVDIWSTT